MKLQKAEKRDKSRSKRKNGMRVSGKSVFAIQNAIVKRSTNVLKGR